MEERKDVKASLGTVKIASKYGLIFGVLLVFVLIGGFFRLYELSSQSYWMDEGYTALGILEAEHPSADIFGQGQPYLCTVYCVPSAWLAHEFGDNAFSYRLLASLAGIAVIVIVYVAATALFDSDIALVAAFFTTFSYLEIAWSRQARWYTLFELFFWLALWCFYEAMYGRHRFAYGVFAAIFTVLAALTHGLGLILPLIFLAWLLIDKLFIRKLFPWKNILRILSGLVVVFIAIALLTHSLYIDKLVRLAGGISLHYEFPYYAGFYFRTYWLLVVLSAVALWNMGRRYTREVGYLLFVTLAYLIPLSFLTSRVEYRYLFHLTPVLFILGTVGLFELLPYLKNNYLKGLAIGVTAFIFLVSGMGITYPQSFYTLEADSLTSPGRLYYDYTPQPDWNAAYAYINANATDDDVVVSSLPQFTSLLLGVPGYWLQYPYLGDDEQATVVDGHESYVGAEVIPDLTSLEALTSAKHGYLVFDYMAADGRIPANELSYIKQNFTLVYSKYTNSYSQIWVYRF